jgi:hypothetical protein
MDESRLQLWYKTGGMVKSNRWVNKWETKNNKINPLIGVLIEDRCPQCGARTWLNAKGNQWCWNCNWETLIN